MTTTTLRRIRYGPSNPPQEAQRAQGRLSLLRVQAATLGQSPPAQAVKAALAVALVAGVVFGDAATAAAIAALGSLVNTWLVGRLSRRVDRVGRELAQPRRIIRDEADRPVASVIARDDDDASPHPRRRIADYRTRRTDDA